MLDTFFGPLLTLVASVGPETLRVLHEYIIGDCPPCTCTRTFDHACRLPMLDMLWKALDRALNMSQGAAQAAVAPLAAHPAPNRAGRPCRALLGVPRGKGAELPPPQITSPASPHRPKASDGSLEP